MTLADVRASDQGAALGVHTMVKCAFGAESAASAITESQIHLG